MKSLTRSLLTAAALSVFAAGTMAQTRVDRSGATDANNRVGSNGQNAVGGRENPWDIANRIVYGNVTGGKQFRGRIASGDPQAFRGPTGTRQFDNFVRDSSGVTTGGVPTYNANTTRAYYGDSRAVAPPAGFVGVSTTGGYSPPVPTAWRNVDPRIAPVSAAATNTPLNAPGDTAVSGGELDTTYAPDAAAGQANITAGLSEYTTLNTSTVAQFTPSQIKQLQGDNPQSRLPGQTPANGPTNNTSGVDAQPQQITPAGTPVQTPGANGTTPAGNAPAGAAPLGGTPESTFVPPTMLNNTVGGNTVGGGANGSGAEVGTVTRLTPRAGQPDTPDKAGTADAAAADASAPQRPGQAAETAARQFNADMKARKQAADTAKNADQPAPKAGDKPAAAQPAAAKPADAAAKPAGPPTKVGTFAGVAAGQGLTDLMTKAEAQMKEGKYGSAIDTYSAAEAVAPRSAILKLGRANAELGGAYYVRAANSLRQAFSADKNLLKNQYDLRAFLGDDRLQTAQKDLSDLVQNHANDTNAAVLLAYVYYNTGNERRAQALLDLADKRSNGRDALVKAMKAGWIFGADETK